MEEKISETPPLVAPSEPTFQLEPSKGKPWLKIVVVSIFGLFLIGGLVFAGFKLGQKQPTFDLILSTFKSLSSNEASETEEYCVKKETGEKMSLFEAREIAQNSECTKEGDFKETHFCNEDTGTWWIDLDIEKEGCNPACVINVATKKAEINWRCTGLIPQ